MKLDRSIPRNHYRRVLAIAIAVAFAATGCKPDSQSTPAVDQQTASPAPVVAPDAAGGTSTVENTIAQAGLHELEATALATSLAQSGLCSLEKIGDQRLVAGQAMTLDSPSAAVVHGWVGDDTTKSWPQQGPSLRFDQVEGGRAWEAGLGTPLDRKDVARHFNADSMRLSGFSALVDLSALPPGEYTMRVVYDRSGRHVACDKNIQLRIGS